ncbi:MAG TPA: penicillin-binding protein activator [Hyphomicrobiaceae bacterium]|jgi:ABC-type branched-subunit amino acid transport system substrate-binding protein|nr:penicillin-binding protein activator [Hyphomicrobiaceae bacterium]
MSRTSRRLLLSNAARAAAGLLLCGALGACSANGPTASASTGALPVAGDPQLADKNATKVVLLAPLSAKGQPGLIGKSLKQAAELALFERNNPNLQLVVKDDKGTPEGARAAAEEAIKSGAQLILGPLLAKSVTAAAAVARPANVPIVAFSTDRSVAGHGVYLLSFQPGPEVDRVVSYAARQGKKRFAVLVPQDAFGKLIEARFRAVAPGEGIEIVALETYSPSTNAIIEPVRKITAAIQAAEAQGAPVDALFIPGAQDNLAMIARLLTQAKIDPQRIKLIGTGGMDDPSLGRDPMLVGAWYPGTDARGWNDFSQKFAKSYGQPPPRIAALGYDAMNVAVALAQGADGQPYTAAALTRASGFTGIDGAFRLLPDGTMQRALAILEVQKSGSSIIEPAPALQGGAAPAAASAGGGSFFSFLNIN